jgi:hypothetical protein
MRGRRIVAKTWKQKLDGGKPSHVEVLTKPFGGAPEGAKMLVATPRLVDEYIRSIPPGQTRSVAQMRTDLAQAHGAEIACPISTSIFARIAAEAALEETGMGKPLSDVTPFWRVIDDKSPLAKKLSCGVDMIRAQRQREEARPERIRHPSL